FSEDFDAAVRCIIAGVDDSGAHIYVGSPGVANCEDSVGFAAVGTGAWHANSYLVPVAAKREMHGDRGIIGVLEPIVLEQKCLPLHCAMWFSRHVAQGREQACESN